MEKEAKRREREAMRLKKAAEKAEAKAQREAERTSKRAMKPGECMKVSNVCSLLSLCLSDISVLICIFWLKV